MRRPSLFFAARIGIVAAVSLLTILGGRGGETAWAENGGLQRLAILRLDHEGNVPDAVKGLFHQRLVEGLAVAGFEVLAGDVVDRQARQSGGSCRDSSCYPALAQTLGVSFLVTGRVSESNKTYDIGLEIINGRSGGVLASRRERCETCGIEEVGEKMSLAAAALRARLEALVREPARVVIRSRPVGADVTVDGRAVGRTPLDLELPGGAHRISLSKAGYASVDRSFTAVSALNEALDEELVRIPSEFPFKPLGYAALAAGVAAVVGGIWAVSMDGQEISCSAMERDRLGHCPYLHDTKAIGAALVGLGAALGSTGAVFLYLGRDASAVGNERASVVVGATGRF